MAKSPKHKKKQWSRSTSLQVNAPMQRAPRVVSVAIAGMQRVLSSGSKVMRRGKNQDSGATVQQGDASTIANAPSESTPDINNLGTNMTQEYGVMDPDASLLSELGSRAPCFGTNTMNQFSPIKSQVATPTQDATLPGVNPGTPPRLNTSSISGVTEVGMDQLDDQGATMIASSASVVGTLILAPSPRQNTQSPETHQLQQTLQDNANEQAHMHSSSSNGGDGASTFSALHTNNTLAMVETVQEGDLDDGHGRRPW